MDVGVIQLTKLKGAKKIKSRKQGLTKTKLCGKVSKFLNFLHPKSAYVQELWTILARGGDGDAVSFGQLEFGVYDFWQDFCGGKPKPKYLER